MKYLIFKVNEKQYGVLLSQLKEIKKDAIYTSVLNLEKSVIGFYNLRNEIIPVLDFNYLMFKEFGQRTLNYIIITNDIKNRGRISFDCEEIINIAEDFELDISKVTNSENKIINAVGKYKEENINIINIYNILKGEIYEK